MTHDSRVIPEASDGGRVARRRAWLAVATVALGTFVMVTTEFLPIREGRARST